MPVFKAVKINYNLNLFYSSEERSHLKTLTNKVRYLMVLFLLVALSMEATFM